MQLRRAAHGVESCIGTVNTLCAGVDIAQGAQMQLHGPTMFGIKLAEKHHDEARELAMRFRVCRFAYLCLVEDGSGLRLGAGICITNIQAVVGKAAADGVEILDTLFDSIE